jgi:hypothetical protein
VTCQRVAQAVVSVMSELLLGEFVLFRHTAHRGSTQSVSKTRECDVSSCCHDGPWFSTKIWRCTTWYKVQALVHVQHKLHLLQCPQ